MKYRLSHVTALTMVWALGGCADVQGTPIDLRESRQGTAGFATTGGAPTPEVSGAASAINAGTGGAAELPPANPLAPAGDTPAGPLQPGAGSDAGTHSEQPGPTHPATASPPDAGSGVVEPPAEPEPVEPPVVEAPVEPPVVEEPEPVEPPVVEAPVEAPVVEEPEPVEPPVVEEPEPVEPSVVEEPEPVEPSVLPPSFEFDVWPIFKASCSTCHTTLRRGRHSVGSPTLATADADARRLGVTLIERLDGGGMPPACSGSPGDVGCIAVAELALIQLWIDMGMAP